MFEAPASPYLVPFDGSFRVAAASTSPVTDGHAHKGKHRKRARSELNQLQRVLAAGDRHAVLLVFQAMDAAGKDGAIKQFERHSRLGFVDQEGFTKEVERLRSLGAKRVTLKTGAYPMRELAMAIKWCSAAKIDLLTIDGAPGGTGMSPWRMMCEWGIPSIYLHAMAVDMNIDPDFNNQKIAAAAARRAEMTAAQTAHFAFGGSMLHPLFVSTRG